MPLFNFMSMLDNYEERKVDCFEGEKGIIIDTCAVTDSDKPYETGIKHPNYNDGEWVIVELYDSKEEAQKGHNKWAKKMTGKKLPTKLRDVSTAEIAILVESLGIFGEEERTYKKTMNANK